MNTTIIYRPVISEKSITMGSVNKYTFKVDQRANVNQIKDAIEKLFKVKVLKVNILNVSGKPKRMGRRKVSRANWKKAVVTISKGQTIKLFEDKGKKDVS
ncbi:MAG: 50S ribosomal protein L23 [Patescibacteria group bacterium]|nr:50S ribosomal protein L23 [Patescibacteria group bacterium]